MKRKIETEFTKVTTGNSAAVSSHLAPFYNLISPHTIRRLAIRKTVGGLKYGSVQWRQGINDSEYVADRFNHFFEHLMQFMENGNATDDNIAGMLWALDCISEVERLRPSALSYIVGISNLQGCAATRFHSIEQIRRKDKKQ